MIYDTIGVKNPTTEDFVGIYSGVDIKIQPGETRYLPEHVARHIGLQLATHIFRKQDRKNPKLIKGISQILDTILSPIIATKEENKHPTIKEEIEQHEKEFAEYLNNQKKEEVLKRTNALEIEI